MKLTWPDPIPDPPSFTCPVCRRTSYNLNDILHQYCGACHTFPEGRAMKLRDFRPGDTFCLQAGGPSFKVLEHVHGLNETVRCTSWNVKLGKDEIHLFAAHFQGIPIALAGAGLKTSA